MKVLIFHGTSCGHRLQRLQREPRGGARRPRPRCPPRLRGPRGDRPDAAGRRRLGDDPQPRDGGLLPEIVRDTYEGFEVKTFAELTDAELDRYLESNVTAVRDLVAELGGVDAALANHLVTGPVILNRAGLRYALRSTVRPLLHGDPVLDRFGLTRREARDGAAGILVGSGHIAARLRRAVDDPVTNAKVRLGPPGVDIDLFVLISPRIGLRGRSARGRRAWVRRAPRRELLGPRSTAAPGRSTGSPTPRSTPSSSAS